MDYQEMLLATMTVPQRKKYYLTKKVVAEFTNFKHYCEEQQEVLNVEGFCRVMGKESGVSPLKIRRILWDKNLVKMERYGKSSKDTDDSIADRSLPTGNGSSNDGNSPMYSL